MGRNDVRLKPRKWQRWASRLYVQLGLRDFLAVVTPGGGKTRWATSIAVELLRIGAIRRVVVVTPSDHVKRQWVAEFSEFGLVLCPTDKVVTNHLAANYQEISHSAESVVRFKNFVLNMPTLVIFDEIHHASDKNSWGQTLKEAFGLAPYRLLLTGTPFRTDCDPIPFVPYAEDRWCSPSIIYGYGNAVRDNICRKLAFHEVPGAVTVRRMRKGKLVNKTLLFSDKLNQRDSRDCLRAALDPAGDYVRGLLAQADAKLREFPEEAGLVIARSKSEARAYAQILFELTGEMPKVVYHGNAEAEESAGRIIAAFREGRGRWLVSVKMVSEGVDIPRLRVLAYLTNTQTEMFFRQAVGRVIRSTGEDEEAFIFMPAHPEFIDFARKIDEDRLHFVAEAEGGGDGFGGARSPSQSSLEVLGSESWESEVFRPFADGERKEDESLCAEASKRNEKRRSWEKAYKARDDVKKRSAERQRCSRQALNSTQEGREKLSFYARRAKDPEVKRRCKDYRDDPQVRARINERRRARYQSRPHTTLNFCSERFKELRISRGLSLSEIQRQCGVSSGNSSAYERGTKRPTDQSVQQMASALRVPVACLGEPIGSPIPPAQDYREEAEG